MFYIESFLKELEIIIPRICVWLSCEEVKQFHTQFISDFFPVCVCIAISVEVCGASVELERRRSAHSNGHDGGYHVSGQAQPPGHCRRS